MSKKSKVWIGLIVVAAILVGTTLYYRRQSAPRLAYREVKIEKGDIEVKILSTGTVEPENRLEIKPPVAGRIEKVLIKEGQTVKKGQILGWMSSAERAALIDGARAEGSEAVKKWEENYKPTPILAPIDGTIILRNVENGQTFTSTDSVFTMSDRLIVKAKVDETDIAKIKVGQEAVITLDAYSKQNIDAKVESVAFDAVTTNNVTTYTVEVLPLKTPDFMRSGMTANVNFLVNSHKDVLIVPNAAVKSDDDVSTVMLKDPNSGSPVTHEVQLALTDGKKSEVTQGLAEGDIVLVPDFDMSKVKQNAANPFMPFSSRKRRK
jgi:macrolide-specific efflux system membrane fusion protein